MEGFALSVQVGVVQPPTLNPRRKALVRPKVSVDELYEGLAAGDRIALGRAVTLVESEAPADLEQANALLELCRPAMGRSLRIGITGVPGVGKSTFIEAMGLDLVENQGRRLAVLAIDPSSSRSGGSILGDKSRMVHLGAHPRAFVRPSPSRMSLGGVTTRTRETLLLCEAAGYDTAFIETVGVGQSETAVHGMVDLFLLLALAGAGDELQGMKRGVMEMADVIAITKCDGENEGRASLARAQMAHALHLYPPGPAGWCPPVVLTSALTGSGLPELWSEVDRFLSLMRSSGEYGRRRERQAVAWFEDETRRLLFLRTAHLEVSELLDALRDQVRSGRLAPWAAAIGAERILRGRP
jgi:LAO/AO transport system kinase